MPIAKQIHAFLEVSEIFLRRSGNGQFNDGLSSMECVGRARDARTLMACVLLNRKTSSDGGNGGGGGSGHGAVPARLEGGA